jgi:hypothetical protein
VEIYDGDSGSYLGKIPQVAHTENVVGLMNSWQVNKKFNIFAVCLKLL